ncbi:hypothetical protein [Clostridium muellerianum]|nr:hypothetical protein [Clostridium muellerianum]
MILNPIPISKEINAAVVEALEVPKYMMWKVLINKDATIEDKNPS